MIEDVILSNVNEWIINGTLKWIPDGRYLVIGGGGWATLRFSDTETTVSGGMDMVMVSNGL